MSSGGVGHEAKWADSYGWDADGGRGGSRCRPEDNANSPTQSESARQHHFPCNSGTLATGGCEASEAEQQPWKAIRDYFDAQIGEPIPPPRDSEKSTTPSGSATARTLTEPQNTEYLIASVPDRKPRISFVLRSLHREPDLGSLGCQLYIRAVLD
jgi:hypothetical protein